MSSPGAYLSERRIIKSKNNVDGSRYPKIIISLKNKVPDGICRIIDVRWMIQFNYKNGVVDGMYQKFYDTHLVMDIPYLNGVKEGLAKQYYINSTGLRPLMAEINFKNGHIDGTFKTYYPNKNISRESFYIKSKRQWYKDYYDDGTVFKFPDFIKGKNYNTIEPSFDFYDDIGYIMKLYDFI